MRAETVYPIAVTVGALVFATLVFLTLFRYMRPKTVESDYSRCNGRWEEAYHYECECGLKQLPQQPRNTYSNLAYLAAGLYIQFTIGTDTAFVFAVTMTYLCIASALYHATSTGWSSVLDQTAILAAFPAIAIFAVAAHLDAGNHPLTPLVMFVAAGLLSYFLSKQVRKYMRAVIAISLGLSYLLLAGYMIRTHNLTPRPYLVWSLVLFAVGFGCWELDRRKKFPGKLWGHAFWHILTAAASALIFYAIDLTQSPPSLP